MAEARVERHDRAEHHTSGGDAHDGEPHDLHFGRLPAEELAVEARPGGNVGAHQVVTDEAAERGDHESSSKDIERAGKVRTSDATRRCSVCTYPTGSHVS